MLTFIHSFSVKMRLAGFISLLLMLLFYTGFTGLNGMLSSNQTLSMVYDQNVIPLNELRTLENLIHSGIVQPVDRLLFEQLTWEECQQRFEKSHKSILELWAKLSTQIAQSKTFSDTANKKEIEKDTKDLIQKTETVLDTLAIIIASRGTEQLDAYTDSSLYPLAENYTQVLDKLTITLLDEIKTEYDKSQANYNRTKSNFIWSLAFSTVLSLLLSYLLIQSINNPLQKIAAAMQQLMKGDLTRKLEYDWNDEFGILIKGFNQMTIYLDELISEIEKSGIQVTSSITEIAATIKQQEATVNEQAATSNEIAASTTEIAATGGNLMLTMSKVAEMTTNTAIAAAESHHRLTKINDIMANMEKATGAIVAKLSILTEKAASITGVTKSISKIADQTNLLSLNAAIEAEKAGEYGSGFSVVSSEIRRLADQTAVATYDIEKMAGEVQSAITSGVMSIENFSEDVRQSAVEIQLSSRQIVEVIDKVQSLTGPIESLNEGISAQTLGAEQISESINQLNEAAHQTAESVSQTNATIFQLNKAALILQDGVARFKLISDNQSNK